jgi:hypothetical protein
MNIPYDFFFGGGGSDQRSILTDIDLMILTRRKSDVVEIKRTNYDTNKKNCPRRHFKKSLVLLGERKQFDFMKHLDKLTY